MTARALAAAASIAGLWLVAAAPACAERLVISLSTHRVLINQNFAGTELTLFGTVETDAASVGRVGGYAIVATVTGPRESTVTWRKQRVAGIWMNTASRTFIGAPSYLAVLASRPLEAIASLDALRRFQVGLAQIMLPQQIGDDVADVTPEDPFRAAFLRVKREHGLYREQANALTFLTPNLFRSTITLPANVPVGEYEIDVKLFADGALLAREQTAFEIVKEGFEQYLASASREHGFLYGFATALLALVSGWLGSVVFRRD
jgi:uncharacterized protein (TIGR02186 family)